jgi:hypothetical protein
MAESQDGGLDAMTAATPWTKRDRDMFRLGVRCAAEFAGTFDGQIKHPYRFEDVILYKFNLRWLKPRRKR